MQGPLESSFYYDNLVSLKYPDFRRQATIPLMDQSMLSYNLLLKPGIYKTVTIRISLLISSGIFHFDSLAKTFS